MRAFFSTSIVTILTLGFSPSYVAAQASRGGGGKSGGTGYVSQTQNKRSIERFNILDWITKQKQAKSQQDMKYGAGSKGLWFTPDFVMTYRQGNAKVSRSTGEFAEVSNQFGRAQLLLNNFVAVGNKTRSVNVDVGFEGYFTNSFGTKITKDQSGTDWSYREQGGGILFRPFGRSSQDTGLILKGGYMDLVERGLWDGLEAERAMNGLYAGAEAKLYLLGFLGGRAEYTTTFLKDVQELSGQWKVSKFYYAAFLEIYLLNVEIYTQQVDWDFAPVEGRKGRDRETSVGLSASMFF
jgi:hypothetical protein